jgi:OPT oligopeptide transporter protein
MNTAVAFVLMFWIIAPIIYCKCPVSEERGPVFNTLALVTNTWNTAFFPISSYYSYDNTGMRYAAKEILTNGVFDAAKYEAYSPVFMSATLALAYGISFAAFLSVFSHTFCEHVPFCVPVALPDKICSVVPQGHCSSIPKHLDKRA